MLLLIYYIMEKFGMENCLTKYQGEINQLVNQRNRIAHGENGITVEYANISDIWELKSMM